MNSFNWPVSLSDVLVYRDIFQTPFEFIHYALRRTDIYRVIKTPQLREETAIGFYMQNQFFMLRDGEPVERPDAVFIEKDFGDAIDDYFFKLLEDASTSPPRQPMPGSFEAVLQGVWDSPFPAKCWAVSWLMNFNFQVREKLSKLIELNVRRSWKEKAPLGFTVQFAAGTKENTIIRIHASLPRCPGDTSYQKDFIRRTMCEKHLTHANRVLGIMVNGCLQALDEPKHLISGIMIDVTPWKPNADLDELCSKIPVKRRPISIDKLPDS